MIYLNIYTSVQRKHLEVEKTNIKANVIMVILKNYILQLERMEVGTTGVWL